jgi:uncharacterized protein YjbI with pentapeptide repeats
VTDFMSEDLTGSVFEDVYLNRARFHDVDLAGADFRLVNLTGVRVRDALRHLVFATDAWVRRAILVDPAPWDPLDLPNDGMHSEPSIPYDREARPSLDEVLALRADRMATVRQVLADLTDAKLAGRTVPVTEPGYPEPESFPVRRCLQAILTEEWEHRLYAERDFGLLQGGLY